MLETVIKLENLTKRFGTFTAVNNISLEVHRGETIGLVGPNGAGKTTTIKMIAKILKPSTGRILIKINNGELQNLQKISRTMSQLGFLIDIPNFYNMRAYDLLRYFAQLQHYPKDKIDQRIDELINLFNLQDWKHENVKNFSKGMTQKLGIIQSLIHDPEIIILDEPQTGLDPLARIEIRKFIRKLQKQGKTIFVASHMLYEISEVCDKIALINHGEILGFDTVENLETGMKIKSVEAMVAEPIESNRLGNIIEKLTARLDSYLDHELDPAISKIPVRYIPAEQEIVIYYKGDKQTRARILKVLVNEFENDFMLISFSKPRTSRLERIYSQLITDDNSNINKGGKK